MKQLTTEEFIKKAREVHGDKYDYSKVNYVNSKTYVEVICPTHGSFWVTPSNFLQGRGCPKCSNIVRSSYHKRSLEEVIDEATKVHQGKYDYKLINEYQSNRVKYPIVCHEKDENGNEHGVFYQDFEHHIGRHQGCPKCSGNAKLNTEIFINRAKALNGDTYDYSNVVYKGIGSKVAIGCKIHGEFNQTPKEHLNGEGCPKCKGTRIWNTRGRKTVEEVKRQFVEVHGDKYDYSKFTEYKNNSEKICVTCKKHGDFLVSANNHLRGRGCPKCKIEANQERQRLPISEVIDRIKRVHGDKFEIPEDFDYKNNHDKVKLICKKHGEFFQNPFNLFKGVGCPQCNKSKLESQLSMVLSDNGIAFEEQKKFEWLGNYELDFYLPHLNMAIECQGIQHFKPIEFFGGEQQFVKQTEDDLRKKTLCIQHGLKVVYYTSNKLFEKYAKSYCLGELLTKNDIIGSLEACNPTKNDIT